MFTNFAGIFDLDMPALLIILAIVLLLFGGKKLPELSKSLGESMKELRKGLGEASGAKEDLKKQANEIKRGLSLDPLVETKTEKAS
jgi:sec-independent protein translocase protein TatA